MAVTLTFEARVDAIEKALATTERMNAKLIAQNRNLADEAKKAGKEMNDGLSVHKVVEENIADLSKLTAKLVGGASLLAALQKVVQVHQEWRDQLHGIADRAAEVNKTIARGDMLTGDVAAAGQIEKQLGQMGVKRADAAAVFASVSATAVTQPLEKRLEITRQAARLAPVMQGEGAAQVAGIAGNLAEFDPTLSGKQAAARALVVTQTARGQAEEITSRRSLQALGHLSEAGFSQEDALSYILAAAKRRERPTVLVDVAEKLHETVDQAKAKRGRHPGRPMTPQEKLRDQFSALEPAERRAALDTDEAMREAVLGEQAGHYRNLLRGNPAKIRGQLQRATKGDYIGDQVALLRESTSGGETAEAYESEMAKTATENLRAGEAHRNKMIREARDVIHQRQGWFTGARQEASWAISDPFASYEAAEKDVSRIGRNILAAEPNNPANAALITVLENIERNTRETANKGHLPAPAAVQENLRQGGEQ